MKIKGEIQDVDYRTEEGEVSVRVFIKTEDGQTVVAIDKNFQPYFYAFPEEDEEKLEEKIEETKFKTDDGVELEVIDTEIVQKRGTEAQKKAVKVITSIPPNVPKLKNKIWELPETARCKEFDIPFYRRYLVDKNLDPCDSVRLEGNKLNSDQKLLKVEINTIENIEKDLNVGYSEIAFDLEVYQDEIIMASVTTQEDSYVYCKESIDRGFVKNVKDEKTLIENLIEDLSSHDIVYGYNTDEFDFGTLRERAQHHGLELSIGRGGERMKFNQRGRFKGARLKGRVHLDLYPFISHILSPGMDSETMDLDSVAEEFLGKNKDDMTWEEMKKSWKNKEDLEEFAEYALKDSELAFELGQEIQPQIFQLSKISGLIPFDTCRLTYGQLTENFLIKEAYKKGRFIENRPSRQKQKERRRKKDYSGGFVYEPDGGLVENIAVLDFKSLYPTVMVSHNISPDTLNQQQCEEKFKPEDFDFYFCQDDPGFFPSLIERLVNSRTRIKKKMKDIENDQKEYKELNNKQQAQKILANSFYGYLGYQGARWYSRECAKATTYMGRQYIQDAIDEAEKMGFEVVYGDTDSVFLHSNNIRENIDDYLEKVNSELPKFMELELEGVFKRGLFTTTDSGDGAKKKYALLGEDGSIKITGFENVRRDWSPIAKKTQEKVLEQVLHGNIDEAFETVKKTVEKLENREVPIEDLKIYTTLTKKPEEYDSTAPHVEAAKRAKKKGRKVEPGDTIEYVITRGGGSVSDRAEVLQEAESYDSQYYVEKQVVPVSLRVLKVFGYTEDQLKGEGKQRGLKEF